MGVPWDGTDGTDVSRLRGMTLPTRAQLYEETDRRYLVANPGAPHRIDPDDPAHDGYEAAWLEIRDSVLHEWTDQIFSGFFPTAGRLDPGNPDDAVLIDYWNDIKHQICDGGPGRWSWDSPPPAPAAAPATTVQYVERDERHGGFLVTFSDFLDEHQAKQILWPNGIPGSASVEMTASLIARVRLDLDALGQMPDEIARMFSEAGILTGE